MAGEQALQIPVVLLSIPVCSNCFSGPTFFLSKTNLTKGEKAKWHTGKDPRYFNCIFT